MKFLNVISIATNVAIILDLVTDTFFRVKGARQKKPTVTDLENDEVWENRRVGYRTTRRDCFHVERHQEIPGNTEKENQYAQVTNHFKQALTRQRNKKKALRLQPIQK